MEEKNIILEAMKKAGEPLNAGKIAELTGLDRKVVDKAMAVMKPVIGQSIIAVVVTIREGLCNFIQS
ncbi:MAG: hypothetical protein IJ899_00785 [Blautia sp.]|nr:hypothetical protein [Blautia sp.]